MNRALLLATTTAAAAALLTAAAAGDSAAPKSFTPCSSSALRLSVHAAGAGAGHRDSSVILTNQAGYTCTLRGFPGVSLLDAAGHQAGHSAKREGSAGATITLRPSASASALLDDVGPNACANDAARRTGVELRVFPPDEYSSLRVRIAPSVGCPSRSTLLVHALGAGTVA